MRICRFLFVVTVAPSPILAQAADTLREFRSAIAPLMTKLCVDCHGEEEPEGILALHNIRPDFSDGDSLETWRMIDDQIRFGDMPPEDADQPTEAERRKLLSWLRGELLKTQEPGAVSDEKLLLPQFGNYVDHLELFDRRRSHVTPAPPRIWRLRPEIYETIMPRLGERITGLGTALNRSTVPTSRTTRPRTFWTRRRRSSCWPMPGWLSRIRSRRTAKTGR